MRPSGTERDLRTVVLILVAVALGAFAFKVLVLGFPLFPNRTAETWDVEARLSFTAAGGAVKVSLLVPPDSGRFLITDASFISRGYGVQTIHSGANRRVTWSVRRASGPQALYYRAAVRRAARAGVEASAAPPVAEKPRWTGAEMTAATALLDEARGHSADVETLVAQVVHRVRASDDQRLKVLLGRSPDDERRVQLAAALLGQAGVPARVVHGIHLKELERDARLESWLQVYSGGRWRWFSPEGGSEQQPHDFLPWWYGAQGLVRITGGNHLESRLAVALNSEAALSGATARGQRLVPKLLKFSLFGLPVDTRVVYHVLLLIPIGVFVLVLMRNVVGVETFGTFMPVLIALAFRETQLLWGLLLFSVIVVLGLAVRFFLDRLQLLLVPRLAAVLIVVVLLMATLSMIMHRLGMPQGLSVALFPLVIITMTIERMSIVWEERGALEAIRQGLGSLAVAALAYLVMNIAWLRHLIFVFPELLLLVLAAVLLLGRYTGYRLLELRRFREFGPGGR